MKDAIKSKKNIKIKIEEVSLDATLWKCIIFHHYGLTDLVKTLTFNL